MLKVMFMGKSCLGGFAREEIYKFGFLNLINEGMYLFVAILIKTQEQPIPCTTSLLSRIKCSTDLIASIQHRKIQIYIESCLGFVSWLGLSEADWLVCLSPESLPLQTTPKGILGPQYQNKYESIIQYRPSSPKRGEHRSISPQEKENF